MRHSLIVLAIVAVGACPAFAADPVKLDVGGGVAFQDAESKSGGTGFDPRGIFGTVGWLAQNGFVARLSMSKTSDESPATADFGFGFEPSVDETDVTRLDVTAGFMFNRHGLVRPILRGGFARVLIQDKMTGFFSGASDEIIDDDDTVISLGAGIEIGQDHHTLLLDLGVDTDLEFNTAFGPAKIDLSTVHVGYIYRF